MSGLEPEERALTSEIAFDMLELAITQIADYDKADYDHSNMLLCVVIAQLLVMCGQIDVKIPRLAAEVSLKNLQRVRANDNVKRDPAPVRH